MLASGRRVDLRAAGHPGEHRAAAPIDRAVARPGPFDEGGRGAAGHLPSDPARPRGAPRRAPSAALALTSPPNSHIAKLRSSPVTSPLGRRAEESRPLV